MKRLEMNGGGAAGNGTSAAEYENRRSGPAWLLRSNRLPGRNRTRRSILLRAADIVEKRGWTQGAAARDADGLSTSPFADDAVAWCGHGALEKAFVDEGGSGLHDDMDACRLAVGKSLAIRGHGFHLVFYNDGFGMDAPHVARMLRVAAESEFPAREDM